MSRRTVALCELDTRRLPLELMWHPHEIRALRRALGLTQDAFARRLCTTQQTVSEWEIGKHRPITYAVAITPEGAVHDLAVLAYREAYGGEVRERRFLKQYVRKTLADPLLPYRDIRNISGATLSVEATGRAARKAIAVLKVAGTLS